MLTFRRRPGLLAARWRPLCMTILLVMAAAAPAHGATFTVDRTDDDRTQTACDEATPNDCSLRGAVLAANALDEPSTINVPAGHYVLTDGAGCSFHGSQDPNDNIPVGTVGICVLKNITIAGASADDTIIDANQAPGAPGVSNPALWIDAFATVVVRDVTITKGNFTIGAGFGHGGGFHNSGTLTVVDAKLTANYSGGFGGGAVYNQAGTLTLIRTEVSQNTASGQGGGLVNSFGTISVVDSLVTLNQAGGQGGGICNFAGVTTITGSTLVDNVADTGGGAFNSNFDTMIVTNTTVRGNLARFGGGIFNDQSGMTLASVTITNNTARWDGEPGRAAGGGLGTLDGSITTVRNSIIAGNEVAATLAAERRRIGLPRMSPIGSLHADWT
ncbi:MAG TPA: hypothetical protein VGK30_20995 [Candidatus Binatia bacterium]|jgi:hypothetical protein